MNERFSVGDRVGRYLLEGLLGEGGMGAVYRAYDETLRRSVALKVVAGVTGGDAEGTHARRILREARMAASFAHPNVVSIFDVGEHEGTSFIVMEVVEGRSLRAFVGGGAAPGRRAGWILDVARALAAAHRRGLVHRDIKPENVMVAEDGMVKVLDFGIAAPSGRAARPLSPTSDTRGGATFATMEGGVVSGTPAYMAPELITEGAFDGRTDQFAWGVLAYEVLAGRHPFSAEGAGLDALLAAITTRDAAPLDPVAVGVTAPLAAAVCRALARDPAARYPSMEALLESAGELPAAPPGHGVALGARAVDTDAPTLGAISIDAPSASPASTARIETAPTVESLTTMSARRMRRRAAAAALLAVGVAGGSLAWLAARRGAPPSFEVRSMRRLPFGAAYAEYPSLSADGSTLVYDAADGKEDHVYRVDLAAGTREPLTRGAGWHYAAAISPSGRDVVYVAYDHAGAGAYHVPVDGSAPPRLVAPGTLSPAWAPDGSAIWAGTKSRPRRFDRDTLAEQRALEPPEAGGYLAIQELSDGRVVSSMSFLAGRGIGIVLHERDGTKRWLWREPVEDALALVPGGSWLLASKLNEAGLVELWQVPIDRGAPRRVGGGDIVARVGLSISAAGDRLAWSTAHPTAVLARLAPAEPGAEALRAVNMAERRQWRDDLVRAVPGTGHLLVASDRRGTTELWVVDPSGAVPPRALGGGGGSIGSTAISLDGAWVAYASGNGIQLTRIDGSLAPRALTDGTTDAGPAFSADGETVFFGRGSGASVEITSVPRRGGEVKRVVPAPAAGPEASPDGRTLAYLVADARHGSAVHTLDLATGSSRPLEGVPRTGYVGLRFARGGGRLAAYGPAQLVDVDLESGRVRRRFEAGIDEITGATYAGDEILVSLRVWTGDVWIAEGLFR